MPTPATPAKQRGTDARGLAATLSNAVAIEYLRGQLLRQLPDAQAAAERDLAQLASVYGARHPSYLLAGSKFESLQARLDELRQRAPADGAVTSWDNRDARAGWRRRARLGNLAGPIVPPGKACLAGWSRHCERMGRLLWVKGRLCTRGASGRRARVA